MSGEMAREGPAAFFSLMAAVSLNLAIFNLLPIPILDGGGILMLLIEMLLRRDLDLRIEGSGGKGRAGVFDDGRGVRDLQRYFEDSSSGLKPAMECRRRCSVRLAADQAGVPAAFFAAAHRLR